MKFCGMSVTICRSARSHVPQDSIFLDTSVRTSNVARVYLIYATPQFSPLTQIYSCSGNILLVIGVILLTKKLCLGHWTRTQDTAKIYRLTTGWTVRGSNTGAAIFFRPVQTGPATHLASCVKGTVSLSRGLKPTGRDADHSTVLAPRLKKDKSYASTPPLDFHGQFQVKIYHCQNIHTHYSTAPFIATFIILIPNHKFNSCVGVLYSVCPMLYSMVDAQLFLQPQPVPHSGHILSHLHLKKVSAKSSYYTENIQPANNCCYGKQEIRQRTENNSVTRVARVDSLSLTHIKGTE